MWETVARTATPLRSRPIFADKSTAVGGVESPQQPKLPSSVPQSRELGPPSSIDRRTTRRIARGGIALDARLDLHGYTQAEAHQLLLQFLSDVRDRGGRLVLVITGKGAIGEGGGVLRRMLPGWLSSPRFRPVVTGFEEAHRSYGGAGAYYVRLRRARNSR